MPLPSFIADNLWQWCGLLFFGLMAWLDSWLNPKPPTPRRKGRY